MLHCTITTNDSQIDVPAKKMLLTVEVIQHKNNPNCVYTKIIDSCMSLDVVRLNSSRLVHDYGDVSPLECHSHSFDRMRFTHKNINRKKIHTLFSPCVFCTRHYNLFVVVCRWVVLIRSHKIYWFHSKYCCCPEKCCVYWKVSATSSELVTLIIKLSRVFITNIQFARGGWFLNVCMCVLINMVFFFRCCQISQLVVMPVNRFKFFCYYFHRCSNVCKAKSIRWSDKKT